MSISKKLLILIGDSSVQNWAVRHGFPKQTVHGWIKNDRLPMGANFDRLIEVTGKPKEWWLSLEDSPPSISAPNDHTLLTEPYTAPYLEGLGQHKLQQHQPTYFARAESHLYIEHISELSASAGAGNLNLTPTDQLAIQISVNEADWHKYVRLNSDKVKMVTVHGDSMYPTLRHGDNILVDIACNRFKNDDIYCIQQGDLTRFKRINVRIDGSIQVKSDNPKYNNGEPEIYKVGEYEEFIIIGKVLPFKFGMIDL